MRNFLFGVGFSTLALSAQGLTEKAVVTGAAAAAARSGTSISTGVNKGLGGLAAAASSSAGSGSKPSPFGESGSRRGRDLPDVASGPDSAVGASPMPSSRRRSAVDARLEPSAPNRVVKAQPVLEDEEDASTLPEPAAPVVAAPVVDVAAATPRPARRRQPAPPARPTPTPEEFRSVAAGSGVADAVTKLGLPSSRMAMWEDGHLFETLRYESRTAVVARIKSVDGKVVSVEVPQ